MATEELRCQGTKADGSPCGVPAELVDPDTRLCSAHAPGAPERMRELGSRGGKAMGERWKRERTLSIEMAERLSEEEMWRLDSYEDAQRWLWWVGVAVAQDKVSAQRAFAIVRAVEAWAKLEAERASVEELKALQEEIERMKGELKGQRPVKAVR